LDESEVIAVIQKEVKIRTESIEGARQGGRPEMVKDYEKEVEVSYKIFFRNNYPMMKFAN
jgi:uncharacterized protein YqeY